jgi:hypothetical protein
LYHSYYEEGEGGLDNTTFTNSTGTKLCEEQLKIGVGSLLAIFFFSFSLFMLTIERKYVKTFFSVETGHGRAKRYFLEGKDPFEKSQILGCQMRQWTSVRLQVKQWLDENWDRWERDKPDWFNSVFIASVDDDIMPKRALAKEKQKAGGGERRRSSLLDHMSIREVVEEPKGLAAEAYNSDDSEGEDSDEEEPASMRLVSEPERNIGSSVR